MTSSDHLAGGRPTPQPSDGGNARQVPVPAAEVPRPRRRAARASVPGGPATSPAPQEVAGGKTSRQADSPTPPLDGTRASFRATPRTGPRDGTRKEAPGTPAGRASDPSGGDERVPAGSSDEDRAEQRAAWKRAESAQHAEARRKATRYVPRSRKGIQAASGPGMVRRMPPPRPPEDAA